MVVQACTTGNWRIYRVSKTETGKRFTPVADGLASLEAARMAAIETGKGKYRLVQMGKPKQVKLKVYAKEYP